MMPHTQTATKGPFTVLQCVFVFMAVLAMFQSLWGVALISVGWAVFVAGAARRFALQDRQWIADQIYVPESSQDLLESHLTESSWSGFLDKKSRSDF